MTFEFLPWLRLGLCNLVQEVDDRSDGAHQRASLELALGVRAGEEVEELRRTVHLLGPGDVVGVLPESIARSGPAPRSGHFEPHHLAFIEFTDADFPWRYTPAAPQGDALRPWLALLVLDASEFEVVEGLGPLSQLHVNAPAALKQDLRQSAAWAHVQVNAELPEDPGEAEAALRALHASQTEALVARLLCPRRLEPHRQVHAFLVPAFEQGRLAGLGEDTTGVPALKPAWSPTDSERRLPIYHRWQFSTADDADFETLARRLTPKALGQMQRPQIGLGRAANQLGLTPPEPLSVDRRAALQAANDGPKPFEGASAQALRVALAAETAQEAVQTLADLPSGEDPLVDVPPLYGRWQAGRHAADPTINPANAPWLEQLNLDPTWRAMAGLGASLVEEHQERFMQEAWSQLDEVAEANRELQAMELGAVVGEVVLEKHLADRSHAEQLQVVAPLQATVELGGVSVPELVAPTALSEAGFDPSLGKLLRPSSRPARALRRALGAGASAMERDALLIGLSENQVPETKAITAAAHVNAGDTSALPLGALNAHASAGSPEGRVVVAVTAANQQDALRASIEGRADFDQFDQASSAARQTLTPTGRLGRAAQARFTHLAVDPVDPATGAPRPVMAAPHIQEPVYRLLLDRDASLIIPGVEAMEAETVSLLGVDQAFVESVLAGMNDAMGSELLWREYPTDQRGSVFQQFWEAPSGLNDITPMHAWPAASRLGSHPPASRGELTALVVRGELVRAFADLEVYAQRAAWHPDSRPADSVRARLLAPPAPENLRAPLFRAEVKGDVLVLGFDLSAGALRGTLNDPGWFINFRERGHRLRFGLDPVAHDTSTWLNPETPSWVNLQATDLSWQHLDVQPLGFAALGDSDRSVTDGASAWTWGPSASSADLASLLLRMPALVGIHATDLLP